MLVILIFQKSSWEIIFEGKENLWEKISQLDDCQVGKNNQVCMIENQKWEWGNLAWLVRAYITKSCRVWKQSRTNNYLNTKVTKPNVPDWIKVLVTVRKRIWEIE